MYKTVRKIIYYFDYYCTDPRFGAVLSYETPFLCMIDMLWRKVTVKSQLRILMFY